MIDKFRSIKPTHLWHHTSLKAFKAVNKDKYDAVKNLDAWFHYPRQNLAFAGFFWASMLAIGYSMGSFSPEKALKELLPYECPPKLRQDMDTCKRGEEKKPKKPACPPPPKKKPCQK